MLNMFSSWRIKSALSLTLVLGCFICFLSKQTPLLQQILPSQSADILRYAYQKSKAEKGSLSDSSIQIEMLTSIDDGQPYLTTLYMIQGMDGGNNHEVWMSLFCKDEKSNKYIWKRDLKVSHRLLGVYDRFEIQGNKIILHGLKMRGNDAFCCPSISVQSILVVKNEAFTLIEGELLTP